MCFDHLIKLYASHHYYTTQAISYQPIYTSTSMFLMTWLIFVFQKRGKKLKYKTYIFVKLFNQDKTI